MLVTKASDAVIQAGLSQAAVCQRLVEIGVSNLHGTSSGSLVDVLRDGLVPTGKHVQVSFTGEMMGGILGLNRSQVSVVANADNQTALSYADKNLLGWSPDRSDQLVALSEGWMRAGGCPEDAIQKWKPVRQEIEEARKARWEGLSDQERGWVCNPFPVVYGISSRIVAQPTATSVAGELSISSARAEELVVFVPDNRLNEVCQMAALKGSFCDIRTLSIFKNAE